MNIEKILETMPDLAEVGLKSRVFNEETLVGLSAAVEDTLKQELVLGDASGASALAFGPNSSASGEKAVALGDSCRAEGLRSIAAGFGNVASAPQSLALGLRAKTLSDDYQAFVWNPQLCAANCYYESHGAGTFSVNPKDGLSGLYVGEETLAGIVGSVVQRAFEAAKAQYEGFISAGVAALSAAGALDLSVSPAGSTVFYPSQAIMAEYAANPTSILAAATVALVGVIGAAGSVKAE